MPKIKNIVFVDFDSFGCPAEQIKKFFEYYRFYNKIVIAVTDGSGFHLGWISKNWPLFKHFIHNKYIISRLWSRQNVILYLDVLMDQLSVKYKFAWKRINYTVREKLFPVYAGYVVWRETRDV